MLVKNGEYNSLWQTVGDLKLKDSKIISLPIQHGQSNKESSQNQVVPVDDSHLNNIEQSIPLNTNVDKVDVADIKTEENSKTKPLVHDSQSPVLNADYYQDNSIMAEIENHQKRHIFAPTLYQAQQNYRELRRLLRRMNAPLSKEKQAQAERKQITVSARQKKQQ